MSHQITEGAIENGLLAIKNGLIKAFGLAAKTRQAGEEFDEQAALAVLAKLKATAGGQAEAAPVSPEQVAKVKAQVAALMAAAKQKVKDPETMAWGLLKLANMVLGSQAPLRDAIGRGGYDAAATAIAQSLEGAVMLLRARRARAKEQQAQPKPTGAPAKQQGSFGAESRSWGDLLGRLVETGFEGPVGDSGRSYRGGGGRMRQRPTLSAPPAEGEEWGAQGEVAGYAPRFDPGPHGGYNPSTELMLNDPMDADESVAGPLRDRLEAIVDFSAASADADRATQLMDEAADWERLPIRTLRLVAGYTPDEPNSHIRKLKLAQEEGKFAIQKQIANAEKGASEAKAMARELEPSGATEYGTGADRAGAQRAQYVATAGQLQSAVVSLGEILATYERVDPSGDEAQERELLIAELKHRIVEAAFGADDMKIRRGGRGTPVIPRREDDVINPYQPGLTRFTPITDESIREALAGRKSFVELCEVASLGWARTPGNQYSRPSGEYGFEFHGARTSPESILKDAAIKRAVGKGWTKLQPVLIQRIEAMLDAAVKNVVKKGRKTLLVQDIPAELQAPELAATEWFITPAILKDMLKEYDLNVSPQFFVALNNAVAAVMDEVLESVKVSGQSLEEIDWGRVGTRAAAGAVGGALAGAPFGSSLVTGIGGAVGGAASAVLDEPPEFIGKVGRAAKGAWTGGVAGAKAGWAGDEDPSVLDVAREPDASGSRQIDIDDPRAQALSDEVETIGTGTEREAQRAVARLAAALATDDEMQAELATDLEEMMGPGSPFWDESGDEDQDDDVKAIIKAMNAWWDAGNGHGFQLYDNADLASD